MSLDFDTYSLKFPRDIVYDVISGNCLYLKIFRKYIKAVKYLNLILNKGFVQFKTWIAWFPIRFRLKSPTRTVIIGEFKKPLRRRRRQRRLTKWIYILPTNLGILLSHLHCLSLSKLSRNWIWDTVINLKYNFKKLAVVVHVLQTTQNWSFLVVVMQKTEKKCTEIYKAHAEPLFRP